MERRTSVALVKNFPNARMLVIGVIAVLISAGMICAHFTRQKITTASDLKTVRGPFLRCYSSTRGNDFDIKLKADYDIYSIPANFLRCFDEDSFRSVVHDGDPLTLLVNNKLVIFSLSDKTGTFLNTDSTIPIYNGSLDIWKGLLVFLMGISIVIGAVIADRNRTWS